MDLANLLGVLVCALVFFFFSVALGAALAVMRRGEHRAASSPSPAPAHLRQATSRQTMLRAGLPHIGSTVSGFAIEGRLGEGGFAAVYRVRRVATGELLAMKALRPARACGLGAADALAREGRIACAIQHPGVPSAVDFGTTPEGLPFLVTELVEGETLEARLLRDEDAGGTSVETALAWLVDTLDIVAHMTAAGVTHCDLSPRNVLLDRRGRIHVIDFGLAKSADATTPRFEVIGSAGFLAPEQARGEQERVGEAADVFAACAIFHLAVTGQRVHEAPTNPQIVRRTARSPVPSIARLRALPPPLVHMIDRGLAFDPAHRPRAAILRESLAVQLRRLQGPTSRVATLRYGDVLPV